MIRAFYYLFINLACCCCCWLERNHWYDLFSMLCACYQELFVYIQSYKLSFLYFQCRHGTTWWLFSLVCCFFFVEMKKKNFSLGVQQKQQEKKLLMFLIEYVYIYIYIYCCLIPLSTHIYFLRSRFHGFPLFYYYYCWTTSSPSSLFLGNYNH